MGWLDQHWVHLHSAMSYCPTVVCLCSTWFNKGGLGSRLTLGTSAFCSVILSWCSRALYTGLDLWGVRGQSALGTSAFFNRSYCPGVVGFCTSGLDYGVHWHWVHLHSAISYCLDVVGLCTLGFNSWGNWNRSACPGYVCICQ